MRALIINCSPVRTGATAEIVKLVSEQLSNKYSVKSICIDDYVFAFCRGCRSCHNTAKCVMSDAGVIENIMREYDEADIIVSVSPSYWAGRYYCLCFSVILGRYSRAVQGIHRQMYTLVQYARAACNY